MRPYGTWAARPSSLGACTIPPSVFAPSCYGHGATASLAIPSRTGISPRGVTGAVLSSSQGRVLDLKARRAPRPTLPFPVISRASGSRTREPARYVGIRGIEPRLPAPRAGALTITRYPVDPAPAGLPALGLLVAGVEKEGFEPSAPRLRAGCSTS